MNLTRRAEFGSTEVFAHALSDAQVDLNPHQIDAALFAARSPISKGALLADEVGLGKTIEAALLLAQRWAERRRKLLVIVPASLRKQWCSELGEKFHLPTVVVERQTIQAERAKGNLNPFDQPAAVVVTSLPFAAKSVDFIRPIEWDMVVIDEAHRLRNVYKASNKNTNAKNANAIKRAVADRFKVLLTATPLQNSLLELYGLVSVIDEYHFGSLAGFKERYIGSRGNAEALKERLAAISKRTLRSDVRQFVKFTERKALLQEFYPSPDEQRLYDWVSAYLQEDHAYGLPGQQRHLITMTLRKLLASSSFAIANTLEATCGRLREMIQTSEQRPEIPAALLEDVDQLELGQEEWQDEGDGEDESSAKDRFLSPGQIEEAKAELGRVEGYVQLARSILKNSKGEALLEALHAGFRRSKEAQGGQVVLNKKALIFTESRRTQEYLLELLESERAGFKGKVVLFNGTNSDARSKAIYDEWLKRYTGSNNITGSKTADMRAALVDYFRDQAEVMIATEAAAEGINLQFCNLVVNYDLPWNPQRIEQRIGRCHRYGQKFDVVVVNFLNKTNAADQRVYELLESKFLLFNSVFGASDEVLGRLDRTGVGFEKRINQIYQSCRTKAEVESAFVRLEKELAEDISRARLRAREDLLSNFDHSVVEKVRVGAEATLDQVARRLWLITRYVLIGNATFNDNSNTFNLHTPPITTEAVPSGNYFLKGTVNGEGYLYRIGHPLAQHVIEASLGEATPNAELVFSFSASGRQPAGLRASIGKSGWLQVTRFRFQFKDGECEEHIVTAGLVDSGEALDADQVASFFELNAEVRGRPEPLSASVEKALNVGVAEERDAKAKNLLGRASKLLKEEADKVEAWEQDKRAEFQVHHNELQDQLNAVIKKIVAALDFREQLALEEEKIRLRGAMDREYARFREQSFNLQDKALALIKQRKQKLEYKEIIEAQFTVRWNLAP